MTAYSYNYARGRFMTMQTVISFSVNRMHYFLTHQTYISALLSSSYTVHLLIYIYPTKLLSVGGGVVKLLHLLLAD